MREGFSPPPVHFNVISGTRDNVNGGLGDQIARLPALKYMVEKHAHVSATVWWPSFFVELAQFLLPHSKFTHKDIKQAPWLMPKPYILFDNDRISTLHLNLVDHAYLILMDQLPPSAASRLYVQADTVHSHNNIRFWESLPGYWCDYLGGEMNIPRYVVFTTDFTAPARAWPAFHINQLAKKVKDAGLQPILLGKTGDFFGGTQASPPDGIKSELFIDLRNKTSLIEALGIMQRAEAVVGADNGLLHLAACTDTPIVFGLTSLEAEHRVPSRPMPSYTGGKENRKVPYPKNPDLYFKGRGLTEVLEAQVPCKGCQSRGFAINTDWRKCLFDDYACTLTLTADRFYEKLQSLGVL